MKNRKKLLFILLVISFLISTNFVFAQGDTIKFRPQIEIPGSEIKPGQEITVTGDTFAKYIISLYNWAIRVIILLAIIMIMIAGFQWMTAAGNAPKVTQAKERIASALIGVLLAVASYTILSFINPSLVSFRSLDLGKEIVGVTIIQTVFCENAKTEDKCIHGVDFILLGCEWVNNKCIEEKMCFLTQDQAQRYVERYGSGTVQCCYNGSLQFDYTYARWHPDRDCNDYCDASGWESRDISECEDNLWKIPGYQDPQDQEPEYIYEWKCVSLTCSTAFGGEICACAFGSDYDTYEDNDCTVGDQPFCDVNYWPTCCGYQE